MSNIQKIDVRLHTTHRVAVKLDPGDERMPADYRKGEFRPTYFGCEWTWRDDQGWVLGTALLGGPMVKKDGTDSLNRGERRFGILRNGDFDGAPQWVLDLVEAHTPTVIGR
jgi:hypothetical protein